MKIVLAGLVAAAAFVSPAAALAHPGIFQVSATLSTNGSLSSQTQYAIANDGYATVLREDNGATVADEGGMLNYKTMPAGLRAGWTADAKRVYGPAQTNVQAHATCVGVPALASGPNILAWQDRSDQDPFFNYVPFQRTSAGLGDDPAKWIPLVRSLTGIDLATADPATACAGLGGTFHAADGTVTTVAGISSATVSAAVGPVQAQLAGLLTVKAGVDASLAAAQADAAAAHAEVARLKLAGTALGFTLPARRSAAAGVAARLAGPAGERVRVRIVVSAARRRTLGLGSAVLASATATFGADATATVTLKPGAAVRRRLKGATPVRFTAVAGQRSLTTASTLAR